MKLVALVRPAMRPDEAAHAVADAAGLTLAEARMRLAPEPPALLARLAPDEADRLVLALREAGLAAVAVEARCPSDRERIVAHSFALDDLGLTLTPRFGEPTTFAWADVTALFRGLRASRSEVERLEKSKRFSVGRAVLTGGLGMTRTSTQAVRSSKEELEQVILVYARSGRAATLSETQLDFSCLGAGMQPSSTGNMLELSRRLREKARSAFYDERLMRLGRRPLPFVAAGESGSVTPTRTTTRTDTSGSLDTLAEVMRQALGEGLLP
ncbi:MULTISPECIES: hypothetical protein [Anaeromyxobacter]|uniref:hypothetical protein n=1 Tax=Anaeromyxobacter TaxID=161492 RepID=UPI001F5AB052|nr:MULTISPECIES: hypothetical protein [unclassified Anaeromyxobacter]